MERKSEYLHLRDYPRPELEIMKAKIAANLDSNSVSNRERQRLIDFNASLIDLIQEKKKSEFEKEFQECVNIDKEGDEYLDRVFTTNLAESVEKDPDMMVTITAPGGKKECYDAIDLFQYVASKLLESKDVPVMDRKELLSLPNAVVIEGIKTPILVLPVNMGLWRRLVKYGSAGQDIVNLFYRDFIPLKQAITRQSFDDLKIPIESLSYVPADHKLKKLWNKFYSTLSTKRMLNRELHEFEHAYNMLPILTQEANEVLGAVSEFLRKDNFISRKRKRD